MLVSSQILFHGIIILIIRGPVSKDAFPRNICDFQLLTVVLRDPLSNIALVFVEYFADHGQRKVQKGQTGIFH